MLYSGVYNIVLHNFEPCYVVYGGPWPFSELETQAVKSYVLERKDSIAAFLTMHNYGQMIMTRWAYTDKLYPPDHNETVRNTSVSVADVDLPVADSMRVLGVTLDRRLTG